MDVVLLIGRILFSIVFLSGAVGHFMQTSAMAGYAESKGVPSAKLAVQVGGVLLALGGISVLLGVWGDLGAILLVIFLVPTAMMMHAFWKETDAAAQQMEMVQFTKDISLAGAALAFVWVFSFEGIGLTLTGPLLGLR
jgi:putative oxidoreductase